MIEFNLRFVQRAFGSPSIAMRLEAVFVPQVTTQVDFLGIRTFAVIALETIRSFSSQVARYLQLF